MHLVGFVIRIHLYGEVSLFIGQFSLPFVEQGGTSIVFAGKKCICHGKVPHFFIFEFCLPFFSMAERISFFADDNVDAFLPIW